MMKFNGFSTFTKSMIWTIRKSHLVLLTILMSSVFYDAHAASLMEVMYSEEMIGHGDAFIIRDRNGIRPAYYYADDEVVVAASERPPIQTAFNVRYKNVRELKPGHALIIKKNGVVNEVPYTKPGERRACSFERIYFSRGTDRAIYLERKKLGELLAPKVLDSIDHDIRNTVFSFVPNTAEVAFQGLVDAVQD